MPKVWHVNDPECPKDAVYGGRKMRGMLNACLYGNPFRIGQLYKGHRMTRAESIAEYKAWLPTQPALLALIKKQHGKDWSCWCAPLPCHCDINLELANEEKP